jgi:hypothetical protein
VGGDGGGGGVIVMNRWWVAVWCGRWGQRRRWSDSDGETRGCHDMSCLRATLLKTNFDYLFY